jgi:hypothetical protein
MRICVSRGARGVALCENWPKHWSKADKVGLILEARKRFMVSNARGSRHGEIRISVAEAGYQMILQRANGAFRCVGSVNYRWYKLLGDILVSDVLLEFVGHLVVQELWFGAEASLCIVDGLEIFDNVWSRACRHWDSMNRASVVVLEHKSCVAPLLAALKNLPVWSV